ncbi:hypothetical protein GLOTRDRAFT_125073 [Gloeophyllum trabeum ATCC 11539]|uniref:Uncharacterized protein n=1 Tax=Gloeophyllum trabeum (strain ATCC 11539 / FP-39264 / Madison 617) TaxID=670483 RepID=S7S5R3_GLOTA|nr:uncharacterized protein GLOTRDRAFT_125073 [Gloeophyllum trabeum ATCC 11539]EPQ61354.1 hypothetical protein GLOTRDRAFT_125073 [Gloeophyllum trabeum ATCC 11539]
MNLQLVVALASKHCPGNMPKAAPESSRRAGKHAAPVKLKQKEPQYEKTAEAPEIVVEDVDGDAVMVCGRPPTLAERVQMAEQPQTQYVVPSQGRSLSRTQSFASLTEAAQHLERVPARATGAVSKPPAHDSDPSSDSLDTDLDIDGIFGAQPRRFLEPPAPTTVPAPSARYALSIGVPARHLEVWDLTDGDAFAWPVCLRLTDTLTACSPGPGLPPVAVLDVECACRGAKGEALYAVSNAPRAVEAGCAGSVRVTEHWRVSGGQGWTLVAWVPVPMRLFRRAETRVFGVRARATLENAQRSVVEAAEVHVSVSHLRSASVLGSRA